MSTVSMVASETPTGVIPDGKWLADVRVESFMKPHPEDQRTPTHDRPLVVPTRWWTQVIGVRANEVAAAFLNGRRTTPKDYGYVSIEQNWQLVSDKPFVVVHFRDDSKYLYREMTASRQMHKGELGQRPPLVHKPQILASEIPDPDNGHWTKNYEDFIRPNLNWVELAELVDIVSLSPTDIIAGFATFSPSTYCEPNVPLLRGMLRRRDIYRAYIGKIPQNFCAGENYWGDDNMFELSQLPSFLEWNGGKAWVPQSFAYKVIRLVHFGYRPENEAPENSFRLEAPMPQPRKAKLPVLSAQELRVLHPLEAQLPKEHSEWFFQTAAERALGTSAWQDASKVMDDKSEGFSYYTNFRRLDLDIEAGNVTVAICHWTRAGADQSDNYYAGLLAVFPKRVADPRRDESAILRIWFFPDSLQRLTPTGSKGGICPPEVPAELTERVQRFVGELGYTI